MPCETYSRYEIEQQQAEAVREAKERANAATRAACAALSIVEDIGRQDELSKEIQAWWDEHRKEDAARREIERKAEAARQETIRMHDLALKAMAKLTPEEQKAIRQIQII